MTSGSSAASDEDELARENQRLERENRRLRERLDAERSQRQAIIDRYEGLVDTCDSPGSPGSPSSGFATAGSDAVRPSVFDRLARFVGLR